MGYEEVVDGLIVGEAGLCESQLAVAQVEIVCGTDVETAFLYGVGALSLADTLSARGYLLDIHLDIVDGNFYLHVYAAFEVLALPAHFLDLYLGLLHLAVALAA